MSFQTFLETPYSNSLGKDFRIKCPNPDHEHDDGIINPNDSKSDFDYASEIFGQSDNKPKMYPLGYTNEEFNHLEHKFKLKINLGRYSSKINPNADDTKQRCNKHFLNILNMSGGEIIEKSFRGFIPFFCKQDGAIFILDFSKPTNDVKFIARPPKTHQERFFCDLLKKALNTPEKNGNLIYKPFILGEELPTKKYLDKAI